MIRREILFPRGGPAVFRSSEALATALQLFLDNWDYHPYQASTSGYNPPLAAADVLLAFEGIKNSPNGPQLILLAPAVEEEQRTGFPAVESLLQATHRAPNVSEEVEPMVVLLSRRQSVRLGRNVWRVGVQRAVADTLALIAIGSPTVSREDRAPFAGAMIRWGEIRNALDHLIRFGGGLGLEQVLSNGWGELKEQFPRWEKDRCNRRCWRSFYVYCRWLSLVSQPNEVGMGVPKQECWHDWERVLGLLYLGLVKEAEEVFIGREAAMAETVAWICGEGGTG